MKKFVLGIMMVAVACLLAGAGYRCGRALAQHTADATPPDHAHR